LSLPSADVHLLALIFAPLADLRETFSSSNRNDEIQFVPKRSLAIAPATPTIAAFASHDSRMLLSLTNGQILVYDTWSLFTPGSDNIFPLHSFSSLSPTAPRQILPNPGDMPNLVAVLREPGVSLSVEILDVQKMEPLGGWNSGNTPDTTPTSCMYSSSRGVACAHDILSIVVAERQTTSCVSIKWRHSDFQPIGNRCPKTPNSAFVVVQQ
jgi:nucleoporin NUP159